MSSNAVCSCLVSERRRASRDLSRAVFSEASTTLESMPIINGTIEQIGTPAEIYSSPVSLFAARFFSELNILDGELQNGVADTCLGKISIDFISSKSNEKISGKVAVCVRQTDISLKAIDVSKSSAAIKSSENDVIGRVVARRFLGNVEVLDVVIESREEPLKIRLKAGVLPQSTSLVMVSVNKNKAMVYKR
ncbi:MAG: hypothetical protein JKY41_13110 [Rhodobacteraceae bacterium]|nr:hypothetical protein [Paracoccaceae bacterium]